jgi:hypothetical protein
MTDRLIVQTAAEVLDTDLLNMQRWMMMAIGYLAETVIGSGGSGTYVEGLGISQTSTASLVVNVARGSIWTLATVDPSSFGALTADANPLFKCGINEASTAITLPAPGTAGQSINYLIEATFSESDAAPVVLPYYDSANPAIVLWGPSGLGTTVNTQRIQRVSLNLKAGTAATTGTQTTPATDTGYVPLFVVPVANGQTQITTANLAATGVGPHLTFKARNANARSFFVGQN